MTLRYQGKRRVADVRVVTDEDGGVGYYAVIVRQNSDFARMNKIGVGHDGTAELGPPAGRGPPVPGSCW